MMKEVKVYSVEAMAFWKELCETCAKSYRIINQSDYSGVEFLTSYID